MMRAVSLRSLKSDRSDFEKSQASYTASSEDGSRKNLEFGDFIEESCKQFDCPVSIAVTKEFQQEPSSKRGKQKLDTKFRRKSIIQPVSDMPSSTELTEPIDDHTLVVTAFYDYSNRLVEINMAKFHYQPVPRVLMQLIALIVPYNRQLARMTIKQCRINMYTIYELSKILPITNITDVCLDHSPVREGNYDILLSDQSLIRNLSLSRCNINDIVCERIAARLRCKEPAEKTLLALNLSSNHITDTGAKQLGEALRTNRHLRYLNIADNHIGDDGARHILDTLTEFQLTYEETSEKRHRYIKYLKKKQILYFKCVSHLTGTSEENGTSKKTSKKGTSGKSKPSMKREKTKESSSVSMSDECITTKAEMMAAELMGPFEDPFAQWNVNVKDGISYSVGNLTLCYLNMAYNNLTYQSVQRLLAVILYQQACTYNRMCGLLKVVIEGNCIPSDCTELKTLNTELHKHTMAFGSRHNKFY